MTCRSRSPRILAEAAAERAEVDHPAALRPRKPCASPPTVWPADDLAVVVHRSSQGFACHRAAEVDHPASLCPKERVGRLVIS